MQNAEMPALFRNILFEIGTSEHSIASRSFYGESRQNPAATTVITLRKNQQKTNNAKNSFFNEV